MPDIPDTPFMEINLSSINDLLEYESKRDYLRSGINVAMKEGVFWNQDWNITIRGNIPINAGASSSSALVIAWLTFLFAAGNQELSPNQRGSLGYQTEVLLNSREAGGMMDHFASSVGNLIYVESNPKFKATKLSAKIGSFVLANSGVKKETVDDLKRVKALALSAFDHVKEIFPRFDKYRTPTCKVEPYLTSLDEDEQKIAYGNLIDRDLTQTAFAMLNNDQEEVDSQKLGEMINQHHEMLKSYVGVSHPIVDEMVEIALKAGALGAKINGSGFGGTMFAYAPQTQESVVQALTDAGFSCWPIEISSGAEIVNE